MKAAVDVNGSRPTDAAGVSREFAEVLEEIAARLQAGEMDEIEALLSQHPEHADELRRVIPAMQLLAEFNSAEHAAAPTGDPGHSEPDPLGAGLGGPSATSASSAKWAAAAWASSTKQSRSA